MVIFDVNVAVDEEVTELTDLIFYENIPSEVFFSL
jgi:hypothetical protein